MGLTFESTRNKSLKDTFNIETKEKTFVIALAGNPNTGKSTIFNSLTGLHQHTGNWPGKTVVNARGNYKYKDRDFLIVDLPGTYSIFASSTEETVARDFICFGNPDAIAVITDATCLERNLNLVFQVMEITTNIILCINLVDEAKKKNIIIDGKSIEKRLGIPVIMSAARNNIGIEELKEAIYNTASNKIKLNYNPIIYNENIENTINKIEHVVKETFPDINSRWLSIRLMDGNESMINSMSKYLDKSALYSLKKFADELCKDMDKENMRDYITEQNYKLAESIKSNYIKISGKSIHKSINPDAIITSKKYGIPLMLLMLCAILWITIKGANLPSDILSKLLFGFEDILTKWFTQINAPNWLYGILVLGIYRTSAWVISVMLPPMAIFFPLFTLLEDVGYLPRVAFNLDHLFKKACAHGKQCLTMCMGLGCNAAGVIGCRIIDSPREKLIATITNNFVPCNGRFPTLIVISSLFFVSTFGFSKIIPAVVITLLILFGIAVTLAISYLLSKTILKGVSSTFTLELPPYRKPQIGRVIYTSIIDRTIFVLWRAVIVAAPAGAVIWILSNIYVGNTSIINHVVMFLNPLGKFIGLDGCILMAFILGLPANEIVLPILLMLYLSTNTMVNVDSILSLKQIFLSHGWTYLTALNTMLFSLLHWPCATTLLTIKKETGSVKWMMFSALIPLLTAFIICLCTTLIYNGLHMLIR
ncbi:ferrous iron transport protein B [Clostridium sp. Mt-5]|uniref:Ferrous iron transport protein B n=1 Tax=Clostridium moutaii TaxID=3240932 RepID=A0ABV4BNY9_9CLOT